MYDAIVIGSRCAGAPTAMLLARAGRRVLVVDRATFPSDVLSGHTIQPAGVARLQRWGLLDKVRATGVPFTANGALRLRAGRARGRAHPRRRDQRRRVHPPHDPRHAAHRRGRRRRRRGAPGLHRAGAAVGRRPGGRHPRPRRHRRHRRGARPHRDRRRRRPVVRRPPGGCADLQRGARHHRQRLLLLPGPRPRRHRALRATGPVLRGHAHQRRPRLREPDGARPRGRPLPGPHGRRLRRDDRRGPPPGRPPRPAPSASSASGGRRPATASSACPSGPGWALVGDAGYHLDPITAQGMLDAFRDAELLADGRRPRPRRQPQRASCSATSGPATPRRCRCTSTPPTSPTSRCRRRPRCRPSSGCSPATPTRRAGSSA